MARPKKYDGNEKERHSQAVIAYQAAALDRIYLSVPKGDKAKYQAAASAAGLSLNEYIRAAINEKIKRGSSSYVLGFPPALHMVADSSTEYGVPRDTADGSKAADDTTKKEEKRKK